jgi:ABC-type amino acid transport substrate-binding protein
MRVICLLLLCGVAYAGENKLVVGTHDLPPLMIKQQDGTWTGISIELLKIIGAELGKELEFRDLPVDELVAGTNKEVDVSVSFNVNAKNDLKFDLTHAFYSTGLAIAVAEPKNTVWAQFARVFSGRALWLVAGGLLLLTVVGLLMYWLEKRPIPAATPEKAALSKALFWAFEPVIGYKSSQHATRAGRILGTIWGLFGVVFISGLTANLASQFTVQKLATAIRGPDDLPRARLAVIYKSAGVRYADRRGLRRTVFDDVDAALAALERGEVDCVVEDLPILAYGAGHGHPKTRVLPGTFENHGYAFGLRIDSPYRRDINRALLKAIASDDWRALLASYLGPAG